MLFGVVDHNEGHYDVSSYSLQQFNDGTGEAGRSVVWWRPSRSFLKLSPMASTFVLIFFYLLRCTRLGTNIVHLFGDICKKTVDYELCQMTVVFSPRCPDCAYILISNCFINLMCSRFFSVHIEFYRSNFDVVSSLGNSISHPICWEVWWSLEMVNRKLWT